MRAAQRGFQTPPEIVRYFEQKSLRPAFSWQDVWNEEHAYAFTVAKAVDLELLALFKSSIQKAIEGGQGFESWRKELIPELQRLGWYGKRVVDDPTGKWKSKVVDFSRPARLQTIFWANVRSARAAGQWERIQRTKRGLPFLLYVRTASQEPRQEHLAWVGVILPVDDTFLEHALPAEWLGLQMFSETDHGTRGGPAQRPRRLHDGPAVDRDADLEQRPHRRGDESPSRDRSGLGRQSRAGARQNAG